MTLKGLKLFVLPCGIVGTIESAVNTVELFVGEYLVDVKTSEELELQRVAVQRALMEIDKIFPRVRAVLEGSDFGLDAVRKAEGVVERARKALEGNDVTALKTSNDAVGKTLNMFKGVVQKIG